jgi:hypothetical protein
MANNPIHLTQEVVHILNHFSPLDINTMMADDRAAVYVLDGVLPVFKSLTPKNTKLCQYSCGVE